MAPPRGHDPLTFALTERRATYCATEEYYQGAKVRVDSNHLNLIKSQSANRSLKNDLLYAPYVWGEVYFEEPIPWQVK